MNEILFKMDADFEIYSSAIIYTKFIIFILKNVQLILL